MSISLIVVDSHTGKPWSPLCTPLKIKALLLLSPTASPSVHAQATQNPTPAPQTHTPMVEHTCVHPRFTRDPILDGRISA